MSTTEQAALATRIEIFLLTRAEWVSVETVCRGCEVTERLLRADGRRRPIFSRFAISSSTKGLKHIRHTTARERITYKHARQKVLIAHARALKEYAQAVHACVTGKLPDLHEVHTNQGLLFQP
jgi:hypothetical protein